METTATEVNRQGALSDTNEPTYIKSSITNDFTLTRTVLGTGINGTVIEGVQKTTNAKFAIKMLKDDAKSRREVSLQYRSRGHPNIVKIFAVYENLYGTSATNERKVVFVVMEHMGGGELFARIQGRAENAFTEREAARIVHSIGSAIRHLHQINIAHRDIKPENLLYADDTERADLKLTDFGFAKETHSHGKSLKTPCYTPYYVAPEVLGTDKYDKSCDIWSLGVITYILMCGYPPFYSRSGLPISPGMKKKIKNGQYDFPKKEWNHVSPACKEIIRKMLKIDPSKRIAIDGLFQHKWISQFEVVPETPLQSNLVLHDEREVWDFVKDDMSTALASMRFDAQDDITNIQLQSVGESSNKLLEKRRKNKSGLEALTIPDNVADNDENIIT